MKLKEQIESKIAELQSQQFPNQYEYNFFEFISTRISESKDLSEVCNSDYLLALLTLEGHESFDVISDTFENINNCLNDCKDDINEDITFLLTTIDGLKRVHLLNEILRFDHEPTAKELDKIIKGYNPEKNGIISGKKSPKLEVVACVLGYKTIGLDIFDDFNKLQSFTRYVEKCENIDCKFTKFINYKRGYKSYSFCKKNYSKLSQIEVLIDNEEINSIDDIIDSMEISDILKAISERYYELSKDKKQFTKNINKQSALYTSMLEVINTLEEDKFINIKDEIFSKLDNSEISSEFIKALLEHNRKVYSKLELNNIKKDKYHQIEKLFSEKDIYLKELAEELRNLLLKEGNIEKLNDIIPFLKEIEFSWLHVNHPNYVQIILNTNKDILQDILNLIRNEVISKEFVTRHIGILMNQIQIPVDENDVEACYDLFRKNIILLSQNTNNLQQKIDKNESIVFLNTETLLTSLMLSKRYGLNLSSDNAKLYGLNILNHCENFDDLDQFIELGYKDYIQDNPQLLREDSQDIITRLSIITNIGLNPINKENRLKGSITNGKNFYVSNERLCEYRILTVDEYTKNEDFDILNTHKKMTISESTENLGIVEYLDSLFKISDLEYQINDVIVSRNKVLRNIECLRQYKDEYEESDIVLSAIIYHSVIDNNTIEFIHNKLSEYKAKVYKKENL